MIDQEKRWPILNREDWRRLAGLTLFALILFSSLVLILTFQFLPSRYDLNEGDVSVYNIKSPQKVSYISQVKTREERERAVAAVGPVYTFDPNVVTQQREKAIEVTRRITEIRQDPTTTEQKRESIKRIPALSLPPHIVSYILSFDEPSWRAVVNETVRILGIVMRSRISSDQLAEVKNGVGNLVSADLDERQTAVIMQLAQSFIKENYAYDPEATEKSKREARDSVQPVRYTIEKGETILRDGDIVKATDLEKLEVVGLRNPQLKWPDIIGVSLVTGMLVLILASYLYLFQSNLVANPRRLLLLGFIIVVAVLAAKLTIPGRDIFAYIFPAAVVPMLVAALLDTQLAVLAAIIVALCLGLIANASLELTTLSLVGGLVGLLGVRRIERLNTIFVAGAAVAVANFLVIIGFRLFSGDLEPQRVAMLAFIALVNGALSAALALGTFSLLGHIFGITTTLGLLELAHPNQPLFRRLLLDAPGTYHHSVLVANLSERAAQAVGADALLARVGAYYHDIGKVVRPYFFVDNQIEGQNVHDQLDPKTSAQIIASHVQEGLELARKHGLPSKVRDIIAQHHGNGLITYFFHRATVGAAGEPPDEEEFRYPGPRPQSKEAAIVMLADSVEAITRCSSDHSPEHIDQLIRKVISERLAEGQLDECDLSLRDLDRIRRAFSSILQGIYHPRIEYPQMTRPMADAAAEPVLDRVLGE
ncbi:MAG: HDIG domain-containing protein [Chloroflexi bacterium]|nr:HDIG domain-containing protein [Chloroflexota bacterium]MCL5074767.1 HDIG domain-containing protein [Chloroflexota bacterium]